MILRDHHRPMVDNEKEILKRNIVSISFFSFTGSGGGGCSSFQPSNLPPPKKQGIHTSKHPSLTIRYFFSLLQCLPLPREKEI